MIFIITYFKTEVYKSSKPTGHPDFQKKTTFTYIRTLCLILERGTITILALMHRTKEILYVKILFQQQNIKATA